MIPLFELLHKSINDVELSEINRMILSCSNIGVNLNEIRKMLINRFNNEDMSKYDEMVRSNLRLIIYELKLGSKEAKKILKQELDRED